MKTKIIVTVSALMVTSLWTNAQVALFPMDISNGNITETVTGNTYNVEGIHTSENVSGAVGNAMRFDGYSSFVNAAVDAQSFSNQTLSISLWCAVETYPMMNVNEAENSYSMIAGNIDDANHKGFAFNLSSQGDFSFECYTGGWKVTCDAPVKMEKNRWNHLVAVIDAANQKVSFYNNGTLLASSRCLSPINVGDSNFQIGKPADSLYSGPFIINTFNGLIDEIAVYNRIMTEEEINIKPENEVNLKIPETRFANDIYRPTFHGMPAAAWTNESHGLAYYNGQYHVFFQKNANGPYMARLHWGHITSPNLYKWTEQDIAISPDESYDIKGCWSGCLFSDDVMTGGKPNIIYTAVDNAKASIAQASPTEDNLLSWRKADNNPIINGRPSGLSDDFRDPYMFKNNGNYYIIVGTSKDGIGATTLHRYNPETKTWSNDGSLFFKGTSVKAHGTFWEMPNVTQMDNNRWLFTTTPLNTAQGVEVLYWTGSIAEDGTFVPLPAFETGPQKVELDGFSSQGYGLLSPSIMKVDGKTIALGIVPDKISGEWNSKLGWAHTYSLPREWTLDDNGYLLQKPYEGLAGMRTNDSYRNTSFTLNGNQSLGPVSGRRMELCGEFTIGSATKFGFNFYKAGSKMAKCYYTPVTNNVTIDISAIDRIVNDGGSFNGMYSSSLPKSFKAGEVIKIHVFIDHSIVDVFINDSWAFSVRVFASDETADDVEVFSEGGETQMVSLNAWNLDENISSSVEDVITQGVANQPSISGGTDGVHYQGVPTDSVIKIYDISGNLKIRKNTDESIGFISMDTKGFFIVNIASSVGNFAQKVMIK